MHYYLNYVNHQVFDHYIQYNLWYNLYLPLVPPFPYSKTEPDGAKVVTNSGSVISNSP